MCYPEERECSVQHPDRDSAETRRGYDGPRIKVMTSPREVLDNLAACDFGALVGLFESEWLDAKETPYVFKSPDKGRNDAAKRELAKDVTALANAGGGVIVLGFDCEKLRTTAGERISKVSPFPISLIDRMQYSQILAKLVHPAPHGVDVLVFENAAKDGKGVAAIIVDKAVMGPGPYLVGKTVDENEANIGSYFGYFERKRDFTPLVSIATIQQRLAAGLQWASLHEHLTSIEAKIDALTPSHKFSPVSTPVPKREREDRIRKARIAAERDDEPLMYFSAVSENACAFPTLFRSHSERVVRLIESPPQLRQQGFEIWADRTSAIIEGRLRRNVIPGHRLIELYEDGEFIFIGEGDEDFLGWRVHGNPNAPIHISNFVLSEATLHFCWLMRWIFEEAEPKPSVLRLALGFANLNRESGPATFRNTPEGQVRGLEYPKPAPSPDREFYELAEWDTYEPAHLAYKLLENVYHWFGYESSSMPYVNNTGPVPKLNALMLVESPLPIHPPPTSGYMSE